MHSDAATEIFRAHLREPFSPTCTGGPKSSDNGCVKHCVRPQACDLHRNPRQLILREDDHASLSPRRRESTSSNLLTKAGTAPCLVPVHLGHHTASWASTEGEGEGGREGGREGAPERRPEGCRSKLPRSRSKSCTQHRTAIILLWDLNLLSEWPIGESSKAERECPSPSPISQLSALQTARTKGTETHSG